MARRRPITCRFPSPVARIMRFAHVRNVSGLALTIVGLFTLIGTNPSTANAEHCPFCSAVAQTLSEEMITNDVVVLAKMIDNNASDTPRLGNGGDVSKATFEVILAIKGDEFHGPMSEFKAVVFGDAVNDDVYFVTGINPPQTSWATPIRLTEREREYIEKLPELPVDGPERMVFFNEHLEDESSMLAADAYDEFARAPYDDVIGIKDQMNHDKLIGWILDEDIPASRKRLYLTMLGICGSNQDLPMLEELMRSPERRKRAGLDAMIACYLTLKGEEGMPLIEELFLANQDAEYADTYAAITALRFHGSEEDVIPKERILQGLRLMLKRPRLADLVIPDLARWNDWEVMDELVDLFKNADESTNWVRVPVVNYLRACPLDIAKEHLKELEEIDPEAIKRANTFFPLPDDDWDDDDWDDEESDDDADDSATDDGDVVDDDADTDDTSADDTTTEVNGGTDSGSNNSSYEVDEQVQLAIDDCLSEPFDSLVDIESEQTSEDIARNETANTALIAQTTPITEEAEETPSEPTQESDANAFQFVSSEVTVEDEPAEATDRNEVQVAQLGQPVAAASIPSANDLASQFLYVLFAGLICVALFLVLWGLLTGRLLRLMS